jgi:hypothetical protein
MKSQPDISPRTDQNAPLEQALMREFLEQRGFSEEGVNRLPEPERHLLLTQASTWASNRLAEVEARAHYVHELHHND